MPQSVSQEQLISLLRRRAETTDLDYKATWDPSVKPDLIELCKDIAAMESVESRIVV